MTPFIHILEFFGWLGLLATPCIAWVVVMNNKARWRREFAAWLKRKTEAFNV